MADSALEHALLLYYTSEIIEPCSFRPHRQQWRLLHGLLLYRARRPSLNKWTRLPELLGCAARQRRHPAQFNNKPGLISGPCWERWTLKRVSHRQSLGSQPTDRWCDLFTFAFTFECGFPLLQRWSLGLDSRIPVNWRWQMHYGVRHPKWGLHGRYSHSQCRHQRTIRPKHSFTYTTFALCSSHQNIERPILSHLRCKRENRQQNAGLRLADISPLHANELK